MLGTGTSSYPFIIQTPADLNNVRNNVAATTYYELGNDIDMSGWGNFALIGESTSTKRFKSRFNGKGFAIKNLTINTTIQYSGLFGYVDGAIIENLAVIDANITSTAGRVGIIAGLLFGSTSVIRNCFTSGTVNGQSFVGGIAGVISGTVENCYSIANVISLYDSNGIARIDSPPAALVKNCYFNGTLTSTTSTSFSAGVSGGFPSDIKLVNGYFNSAKAQSNVSDNSYGIHLSETQMKQKASFAGFDETVWTFEEGKFPYLKLFGEFDTPDAPIPPKKETVSISSYSELILSSLERSKRKLQTALTFTLPMNQTLSKKALAIAKSTIDDIVSNVEALQNANIKTHIVSSHVDGVGSTSSKLVKAIRSVESATQPFTIITNIVIPVDDELPVYATVFVQENQSNLTTIINKSNTNIKENATEMQVV